MTAQTQPATGLGERLLRGLKRSVLAALLATSAGDVLAREPVEAPSERASGSFDRLFFSPERRADLNRHRQLNLPENESLGEDDSLTLNGIVARRSGKRTVWINGVPVTESSLLLGVQPRSGRPGSARVSSGNGAPATLNVGSTLNRGSGEVSSGLGDGWLRVRER